VRFSHAVLPALPANVVQPGGAAGGPTFTIVHFGIGAFHRAHQAWYTERAGDHPGAADWSIVGVSLRSPAVADQLNPQQGLYTVAERSAAGTALRVVGSVREVLVADQDPDAVIRALADEATRIVSLTVPKRATAARRGAGSTMPARMREASIVSCSRACVSDATRGFPA